MVAKTDNPGKYHRATILKMLTTQAQIMIYAINNDLRFKALWLDCPHGQHAILIASSSFFWFVLNCADAFEETRFDVKWGFVM